MKATDLADGSMSIIFGCASCGNRVSLLTNPGETQLVRALDVQIGGRTVPPEPMGLVRSALARQRDDAFVSQSDVPQPKEGVIWTEDALRRLENVPAFVRDMARKSIERYAMEKGCHQITPEVMDLARKATGG
ncbi:MAG: PCP reductase family protein [Chloroflexi bacterium]|nr:PCP reductase family protein [Chloroflexota bacterium]